MRMLSPKYASSNFWTHNKTDLRIPIAEYVIRLERLGFSGHGVEEPTNVATTTMAPHTTSIIIFSYFIYCFFRWLNISTTMNWKSDICRYANTNKIFCYYTYLEVYHVSIQKTTGTPILFFRLYEPMLGAIVLSLLRKTNTISIH